VKLIQTKPVYQFAITESLKTAEGQMYIVL